jgi:hypothetical protein
MSRLGIDFFLFILFYTWLATINPFVINIFQEKGKQTSIVIVIFKYMILYLHLSLLLVYGKRMRKGVFICRVKCEV